MRNEVFWKNPGYKISPALKNIIECDYLIVGGGITGVSLAYFLVKGGAKNIVLVEKHFIGSGATGKSAGILTLKGELDLNQIIENHRMKKGMLYWKGNQEGLELIRKIIKKEKINCDFEPQHTILGGFDNDDLYILKEHKIEKKIEKTSRLLSGENLRREINTPLFKSALFSYYHGVSVNPLKHVQSLSKVVKKNGVKIFENTPFLGIRNHTAITPNGKISFKKIIFAIDVDTRRGEVKNRKSTIIVTEKLTEKQLKKISLFNKKFVWDSKEEYHYLKITKDNRILLGFGDKIVPKYHRKIHPHHLHLKDLKIFIKKLFPQINVKIEYAWSAHFGTTDNLIPIIKIEKDRTTIAGAGSQVVCVMSAKYIADKLTKKKSILDFFFKI